MRPFYALPAAVAGMLLVAACGDDGGEDHISLTGSRPTTTTTAVEVDEEDGAPAEETADEDEAPVEGPADEEAADEGEPSPTDQDEAANPADEGENGAEAEATEQQPPDEPGS